MRYIPEAAIQRSCVDQASLEIVLTILETRESGRCRLHEHQTCIKHVCLVHNGSVARIIRWLDVNLGHHNNIYDLPLIFPRLEASTFPLFRSSRPRHLPLRILACHTILLFSGALLLSVSPSRTTPLHNESRCLAQSPFEYTLSKPSTTTKTLPLPPSTRTTHPVKRTLEHESRSACVPSAPSSYNDRIAYSFLPTF